jgi:Fur family ferric uptake transcriptional regulator
MKKVFKSGLHLEWSGEMSRSKNYHTKQQEIILKYLRQKGAGYVTVSHIAAHLKEQGQSVGLTTIYRQLDKFEREGIVHKIVLDGNSGACYQYAGEKNDSFLLKCEGCGGIMPMECSHMEELYRHVLEEHSFRVNPHRTMFYGICDGCLHKKGQLTEAEEGEKRHEEKSFE